MKNYWTVLGCFIVIAGTALSTGCYKDSKEAMFPSVGCDTTNITWTKDIKEIVNNSCALSGCHDAVGSGGYNLTTYSGVKTMVDSKRFLAVLEDERSNPCPRVLMLFCHHTNSGIVRLL